jgi:hypothetical protein
MGKVWVYVYALMAQRNGFLGTYGLSLIHAQPSN